MPLGARRAVNAIDSVFAVDVDGLGPNAGVFFPDRCVRGSEVEIAIDAQRGRRNGGAVVPSRGIGSREVGNLPPYASNLLPNRVRIRVDVEITVFSERSLPALRLPNAKPDCQPKSHCWRAPP